MATIYRAEIPTQYRSEHSTARAAIKALEHAEELLGIKGNVIALEKSGVYTSRQVIHPNAGDIHSA